MRKAMHRRRRAELSPGDALGGPEVPAAIMPPGPGSSMPVPMLDLETPDNGAREGDKMTMTAARLERRNPLTPCHSLMPTFREVIDVFEGLEGGLGFLEFNYVCQRKPRKSCPSVDAQREDTEYSRAGEEDPSLVRAYVPHGGQHEKGYWIFENKQGNPLVRLRPMDRRAAGTGYHAQYGIQAGEYLWRSYRIGGIKLDTVKAVVDGVKSRLFPNAPEGFRRGF